MKINLPNTPRGVPNVTEIEDVLRVICHKADLDPNRVRLTIIGGDRRRFFTQQGVKLMSVSVNALGVPLYVGCRKDTVEGNFHCEGMNATELHSKLMGAFGNSKAHVVDERRIRNARELEREKTNPTRPPIPTPNPEREPGTGNALSTSLIRLIPTADNRQLHAVQQSNPPAPAANPANNGTSTANPVASEEAELPKTKNTLPFLLAEEDGSLARNTRNLHMALVSLATHFKVNQPFTCAQLREIIENDVGIHNNAGAKVHIRTLANPGFITRLNPNKLPARYATTELCEEIVGKSDEEALRLIIESQQRAHELKISKEEPGEEPPPPPKSFVQQAQELRASEEQFQKLLRDTEIRASELQKLQVRNFDAEKKDVDGQIANLEKRLGELRTGLEEIETARKRVVDLAQEVSEMRKRATEGPLARAHLEFQELRKAMGS